MIFGGGKILTLEVKKLSFPSFSMTTHLKVSVLCCLHKISAQSFPPFVYIFTSRNCLLLKVVEFFSDSCSC